VQSFAEGQNIPVYHPKSLKSEDVQAEFAAHNLDIAIVAAYGLLLPKVILDAPKYGCINIHGSLLPRWRGASPIQRAIWQGDPQSGITIMQMDEGLDTGPEILKRAIDLAPQETATTLHDRLAVLGAEMTLETLDLLAKNGQLITKEQKNEGATYAHLLKKDDGKIDWDQSAPQIDRQIRALNPWPGVYTDSQDQRFKITQAEPALIPAEKNQPVGMLLDKAGHIACADNTTLKIIKIQPAGKQAMDITSALNGGYIKIGQVFE
jgi:methionyl-tRNA formyltransferase